MEDRILYKQLSKIRMKREGCRMNHWARSLRNISIALTSSLAAPGPPPNIFFFFHKAIIHELPSNKGKCLKVGSIIHTGGYGEYDTASSLPLSLHCLCVAPWLRPPPFPLHAMHASLLTCSPDSDLHSAKDYYVTYSSPHLSLLYTSSIIPKCHRHHSPSLLSNMRLRHVRAHASLELLPLIRCR